MKERLPDHRPKQETPEDLIARLLGVVRGQFCADLDDKGWFQHAHFVRRNVVLWPARFMQGKGFTLPVARFEQILRGVFAEIKAHGQTGEVRYWPGYLMKCVQEHFRHNWEEYYGEAKSARTLAETVLANSGKVCQVDRGVETLALAHRVLTAARKKSKVAPARKQLNLFLT